MKRGALRTQETRYRLVIVGLLVLLNFTLGLNFGGVAPVLSVMMESLDVGRGAGGVLAGGGLAVMAVASLPAGYLAVRLGLKRTIAAGWLLSGVTALTPLADSYGSVLTLRLLLGVGAAIAFPATGPLVMQWFRRSQVALISGVMIAAMSAGLAVSLFTTAPVAEVLGWQEALALQGLLSLGGGVLWLLLGRTTGTAIGLDAQATWQQVRRALTTKITWLVALADAGPFALYIALTSWLPTFYGEELGMSASRAGILTGLLPLVGIFAVLVGGAIASVPSRTRPLFVTLGLLASLSGFGVFLLGEGPLLYLALLGLGIASWAYLPALMTLPMQLSETTPEQVAIIWALLLTTGGLVSFISPLAVGAMADALGTYTPGFTVWAVLALSLAAAGLALPRMGAKRAAGDEAREAA